MKIGAVDADAHRSLGGQYGVQGFPTIKIFAENKQKPEDYRGLHCSARYVRGVPKAFLSVTACWL